MAGDFNAGKVTVEIAVLDALTDDVKRMEKTLAGFGASTEKQASKLDRFQKKAASVGKSLTMKVTAPILGAGAASFKMAADFEKSMTKITTLVGISAKEVKAMEKDVLALSGKTAQAPKDLADAMFFIQSAGLRGSAATETLEASAKAAAVGLGEAATIADLATSALNAYGESNISATQATDVMVAAVREGKLEADELAGSMGRVLPIASAMGVGFDEVGAAFASLSRTGTNAAEAATQVRGIMASLLRPTKQAEEALTGMGLSSENLRKQMREEGLLASLETLSEKFAGNEAAAASVFGNIRALSGVMDLMGANVETTRQIFENMTDTTGMLDEAFAGTAETASFKLSQAMAEFKKSMIVLGQQVLPVVLPIIENIGKFIARAAEAFNNLSPGIKKAIVIIAGLTAVVGPALIALSAMITAIKTVKAVMMAANPWFLAIGAAIALVGIAMAKRSQDAANFKKEVQKTQDVLMTINPEIEGVTSRLEALADTLPDAADPMGDLAEKAKEVGTESLYAAKVTGTDLYKSFKKIRDAGVEVEKVLVKDISKLDKFITEVDRGNGITNAAMNEIKGMSKEGRQLARELADLHDAEEITINDMRQLVEDIEEVNAALEEATKQSKATADEFLKSEDAYKIITQQLGFSTTAADDFHDSLLQMAKDADDPRVALRHLEDQVEEVALAHNYATAEFADFREEAKATAIQAEEVAQTWEQLKDIADQRALYFTLALDTTGLYEQLNEAMMAIIDVGSLMPGGDSQALETQLAITRRISAKLMDTKASDRKAMSTAAKAAADEFEKFFTQTTGLGDAAMSESFAQAIVGSPEQIEKAFAKLFDQAFDDGLTNIPGLRTTLTKALEAKDGLIALAEQRLELTSKLATAEDSLATALKNQESAQARVNSLMDARASMAERTASAFGFKFGEDIGAKAQAQQLLTQYTTFEGNLRQLVTRGFPADIIGQVIGLGAIAGNTTAEQLLAMGDTDFTDFITSLSGISAIGQAIGNLQAGMMFDASIAGAQSSLGTAQLGAAGARTARDTLAQQLNDIAPAMDALAKSMQTDFGTGIAAFIRTMDPLPEHLQRVFDIFLADLQAIILGEGKGITAMGSAATGSIPRLLAAAASGGISGINGGAGGSAGANAPGSRTNPIAIVPIAAPSAGMSALIDAGSLDTIGAVNSRARARRESSALAFGMADVGSFGITGRQGSQVGVDAIAGGVVINVQGSIIREKELGEVIRQISLEDQRSGKSWTASVL